MQFITTFLRLNTDRNTQQSFHTNAHKPIHKIHTKSNTDNPTHHFLRQSNCWHRVSTTPGNTGNTGNLLEFEISPGNTGNLLDFC